VQRKVNMEEMSIGVLEKLFYFLNIAEGDKPTKVN